MQLSVPVSGTPLQFPLSSSATEDALRQERTWHRTPALTCPQVMETVIRDRLEDSIPGESPDYRQVMKGQSITYTKI